MKERTAWPCATPTSTIFLFYVDEKIVCGVTVNAVEGEKKI